MSRDSAARELYLSQVKEAFGLNPYPALASMCLPEVAELVRQHATSTSFLSQPKNTPSSPRPSSAAPLSAAAGLSSDLPAVAGEEVWPPLKDVCTGCGEQFSTEFGLRHCS